MHDDRDATVPSCLISNQPFVPIPEASPSSHQGTLPPMYELSSTTGGHGSELLLGFSKYICPLLRVYALDMCSSCAVLFLGPGRGPSG